MLYRTAAVSERKELRDFLKLPYTVYAGDRNWIPPLESEVRRTLNKRKNPYFRNAALQLFNCYKDNAIAARTAVIINRAYDKEFNKRTALFGFFECINDRYAAEELFKEVFNYCRENEVKQIIGPFNPNHYSETGLQISEFDTPPSFFQTYNPPYYYELLDQLGFIISKKIHTRKRENINEYLKDRFGNKNITIPPEYSFRQFDPGKKEEELEVLRNIYNDAFEENPFFLPVSRDEYLFAAKYLSLVTDPHLLLFAEYKGEAVGVIHFALDINPLLKEFKGRTGIIKLIKFFRGRKKIDRLIFYATGIKKSHRNTKTIQVLLKAVIDTARKYGALETTWMSYDNIAAIGSAKKLGLEPDKEFAILSREI